MAKVDSGYIRSLDYDGGSRILTVSFRDGCTTKYFSVHPRTYQAILNADSHGEAFIRLIRDKHNFKVIKQAA